MSKRFSRMPTAAPAALVVVCLSMISCDDEVTGPSADVREAIAEVRAATEGLRIVDRAEDAGYAAFGDCFDNPGVGAMGFHYANDALIGDPVIDGRRPELLLFERMADGTTELVGVEYIVFQDAWHEAGNEAAPSLYGSNFHLNTTLLDEPFYALHVWAWKENPRGTFEDWNPRVQCR